MGTLFKPGDVVYHKASGQRMVVIQAYDLSEEKGIMVRCRVWLTQSQTLATDTFYSFELVGEIKEL